MAGTRKVGEKIPLAVVGKDGISEASEHAERGTDDAERETTIAQLTESLKALRAQVEQLSATIARASGKATDAVTQSAAVATDAVSSTVRTYPFYSVLAASAAAFLLGRLSAAPPRSVTERNFDRIAGLASRLPPQMMDAIRARLQ
jgi:ElaB/YqjD/DUF883 family membrane-anchored ribosome-binding protein